MVGLNPITRVRGHGRRREVGVWGLGVRVRVIGGSLGIDVGGDIVGLRSKPSRAYGWRGGRGGGRVGGARSRAIPRT